MQKKFFFHDDFFKIHFIRFEMHMDRPDKSEDTFGFKKKDMFLQSTHQVDMKNVVERWKEFFAYFNALENIGCLLKLW